ncbi:hypothetical protein [Streptomyces fradiae]|uniref:hypothetical protein n=1 Tax=Streptomyces fradiae TaxID=1906 RepID=UPI002943CDEB|nr:hypothetical protein [Streptomyces fradiae]WOI63055.1 hypothetical protein RYQ63_25955 [Streptomyces fradiae]
MTSEFGLISFRDFGVAEVPESEDPAAAVHFHSRNVYVATRSDADGEVNVQVRCGSPDLSGYREVLDASMDFRSALLCIQDVVEEDVPAVRLPRDGFWGVRIFVNDVSLPDSVVLFLDSMEFGR